MRALETLLLIGAVLGYLTAGVAVARATRVSAALAPLVVLFWPLGGVLWINRLWLALGRLISKR